MLKIGIDPDLQKSGVATVRNGRIVELYAMPFFTLISFINENMADAQFVIEDVNFHKPTFHRPGASKHEMLKIAQDVGKVKAVGMLLADYLKDSGANFRLVKPLKGTVKKAKNGKGAAEFFNRLTGWEGQSNEDKRDAALLALYG